MAQDLHALADEDLMQLVRRGEASAFELVYERHASAAFSLAYRMVGTRNGAEDVSQEAFLSLWRSGARYDRARGSVRTWVLGIVHHRAIDYLRRATVHDKRRASDEGMEERFEARERTEAEVARRDEARTVRERDGRAALRAEPGDRARLLRRVHPHRDRRDARDARRDDQGPHAARPQEASRPTRGRRGDALMQMPGPGHDRWGDATAAYVLGALDETERAAFEEHLAGCPACREEVDDLLPAARALPVSAEPVDPPPSLKARIMAEVEREASLLAAAGPEADRPPAPASERGRRRRFSLRIPRLVPVAAAAALLVVGVAIGVGASQLGSGPERTVTAQVSDAPGATVQLEVNGEEGHLMARDLPAPPDGRVYQVWLKRDGHAPEPTAALFTPEPRRHGHGLRARLAGGRRPGDGHRRARRRVPAADRRSAGGGGPVLIERAVRGGC